MNNNQKVNNQKVTPEEFIKAFEKPIEISVNRFYDQQAAQQRIQPTMVEFVEKLTESVHPNNVETSKIPSGLRIRIWKHDETTLGEEYLLQYDGVNAAYRFNGYVRR